LRSPRTVYEQPRACCAAADAVRRPGRTGRRVSYRCHRACADGKFNLVTNIRARSNPLGQVGAHGTGAAIPPVDETVVALTLVTPGQVRHQPRQIRQALPYPRRPVRQRVVQPAGLWEAAGAGVCPARVVPGLGSSSKRVTCGGVRASMAGAARLRRQGRQRAVRTLPSQARSKREARFCRQRARTGYAAPERGRRPGAAF